MSNYLIKNKIQLYKLVVWLIGFDEFVIRTSCSSSTRINTLKSMHQWSFETIYIYTCICRKIYEEYCCAMSRLSIQIMELLAMSLGVKPSHFKDFFQENESIMRLNYYPPCQNPDQTLGTGPHCDPTSLTILHQDNIGGLQVFVDNQWRSIPPIPNAFVVNIGDTFMVPININ